MVLESEQGKLSAKRRSRGRESSTCKTETEKSKIQRGWTETKKRSKICRIAEWVTRALGSVTG